MKTRLGFVSNSSSASFIIARKNLTEDQENSLRWHIEKGARHGIRADKHDRWTVRFTKEQVYGSTSMTNFDMRKFMRIIGIADEHIKWEDD